MFNIKQVAMKNFFFTFLIIGFSTSLWAAEFPLGHNPKQKEKEIRNSDPAAYAKANCSPSSARLFLDFNDVRCLVEVGGLIWMNRQVSAPSYEVPKGGGNHVIFAGSIWMGGLDVNGQLKLAAVKFRVGNDFWAGPLSQLVGSGNYDPSQPVGFDAIRDFGAATIDPDVCIQYDRFFTMRKAEVIAFALAFECAQNPDCTDEFPILTNEVLNRINNWPAHGDVSRGQDFYLAPFYDYPSDGSSGDGIYDPSQGDHPWYDDILGRDDIECGIDRRISLFGDETHWWVFNDKGNIHTETGADPIGMEIRAQAFAFATNDEVNRMTFYNYEMINRSTQTLFNTYFTQYCDADVGFAFDDYVGCDVSRGLGYAYNATNFDPGGSGAPGYGDNPPAVGIDFFEGPYQDADGVDNVGPRFETQPDGTSLWVVPTLSEALSTGGIVYRDLGIGYSDGIIDNERYGMRRFNYYTNGGGPTGDPNTPTDFYNFMLGNWKDNSPNYYGGNGYTGSVGVTSIVSSHLYPNDSDPLFWATQGVDPGWNWSETNTDGAGSANPSNEDKRFMQHAGPFTLTPGAVNNLTVGVVYGRAFEGNPYASVLAVKRNDTKAQALFDNCFRILDPPNAPVVEIVELENELILLLDNPFGNNVDETYAEEDNINIIAPLDGSPIDRFYRFEGYQIYQMRNVEAGVSDIGDIDKARLVAQCDIENNVARLINFEFDEVLGFSVPVERVNGENRGIRHSFRIIEDAFADGENRRLVNHKTYYYIAIAYAHNEFKEFDPNDPEKLDGQKLPYIASRLAADGSAIAPIPAIPHKPSPRFDGTIQRMNYGDSPLITRLDGRGNGNSAVDLTRKSESFIIANGFMENPTYTRSGSPIRVKVIDPLNLVDGYFNLRFVNYSSIDTASWVLEWYNQKGGNLLGSVNSRRTIAINNEQLIPEWGISVQIQQQRYPCASGASNCAFRDRIARPIEATVRFADTSKIWLAGVPDNNGFNPQNWITSGDYVAGANELNPDAGLFNPGCYNDLVGRDPNRLYASLLGGIVTAGQLARFNGCGYNPIAIPGNPVITSTAYQSMAVNQQSTVYHPSIDLVITDDRSKWTRCAVIELGFEQNLNVGQARPGMLRQSASVDQNGNPDGSGIGMSWFPGYAIDVESGRRLNMAFGENSFLAGQNGADMIWNPTSNFYNSVGSPLFGGQHTIYVFGGEWDDMPAYDQGEFIRTKLAANNGTDYRSVFRNLSWVMQPMLIPGRELLSTDVRIRLRINKQYENFVATGSNAGRPSYEWRMDGLSTVKGDEETLASVLDIINVVPNPYYAFSEYERDRRDTRVKIVNLPERCKVRIYDVSGKLVRAFDKDSPLTSIDWDLKNGQIIPISGGVYLIHVEVPGIGERVVKFFCVMRQPDLENL
jgi:hypothetical protein